MASQQDTQVMMSSGNVFADLGVAEPEEELAKAQLASHIRQTIKHRRLTQAAAALLMGVDQPKARMRKRMEEMGSVPATPETVKAEYLTKMVDSEMTRWATVIQAAGISEP